MKSYMKSQGHMIAKLLCDWTKTEIYGIRRDMNLQTMFSLQNKKNMRVKGHWYIYISHCGNIHDVRPKITNSVAIHYIHARKKGDSN